MTKTIAQLCCLAMLVSIPCVAGCGGSKDAKIIAPGDQATVKTPEQQKSYEEAMKAANAAGPGGN